MGKTNIISLLYSQIDILFATFSPCIALQVQSKYKDLRK